MIKTAILTISDRSFSLVRADLSGPALQEIVLSLGWEIVAIKILPDDIEQISDQLISWADSEVANLILTTGGTGFAPRDVTPEATIKVLHRLAPGLDEAMRFSSLAKNPHAMLSRGVCGIRHHTLIINLPGNPKAAVENFQSILSVIPHAIELLTDSPDGESHHKVG